jgi:hypothetical protein
MDTSRGWHLTFIASSLIFPALFCLHVEEVETMDTSMQEVYLFWDRKHKEPFRTFFTETLNIEPDAHATDKKIYEIL